MFFGSIVGSDYYILLLICIALVTRKYSSSGSSINITGDHSK